MGAGRAAAGGGGFCGDVATLGAVVVEPASLADAATITMTIKSSAAGAAISIQRGNGRRGVGST
jgi:hypothetical protein